MKSTSTTNRRAFLCTSLAAGALPALATIVANAEAPATTARPVDDRVASPAWPTVFVQGDNAATIVWQVHTLGTGFIEYGPTRQLGSTASGSVNGLRPWDDTVISVPLTGLTPGQKVYYRTVTASLAFPNHYAIRRGDAVASPIFEFTLPAASRSSARLAVWNDTHEQAETLAALRRTTAAFAPDALVVNGDVPHDQFRCIQDLADNFLNPTKGATGPQWPVIFVRGNHDARGVAAHALPRFAPTSQPEGYVNLLRYGPIGIIILDTGEDKDGPDVYGGLLDFAAYRRTQYQWLERAAADQRFVEAPFRLVFCHIPLRWKNPASRNVWCEDGDTRWSPVLAKAKVQAVISGHTHQFWHDPPTPARPFHQVTGGGPEITSTRWSPTPATVTQVVAETGVLTLRVVEAASGKEHLHLQIRA